MGHQSWSLQLSSREKSSGSEPTFTACFAMRAEFFRCDLRRLWSDGKDFLDRQRIGQRSWGRRPPAVGLKGRDSIAPDNSWGNSSHSGAINRGYLAAF
jgi:hypothetical protein